MIEETFHMDGPLYVLQDSSDINVGACMHVIAQTTLVTSTLLE